MKYLCLLKDVLNVITGMRVVFLGVRQFLTTRRPWKHTRILFGRIINCDELLDRYLRFGLKWLVDQSNYLTVFSLCANVKDIKGDSRS